MDNSEDRGRLTPAQYDALSARLAGSPREAENGIEWPIICPFHEDTKRSAEVNITKMIWWCHACQDGGTVDDLFAREPDWLPVPAAATTVRVTRARRQSNKKLDQEFVDRCAKRLALHEDFQSAREYLDSRHVTAEVRERYLIGHYAGRIAFPIYEVEKLVNMRLYSRFDQPKMMSFGPGTGKSALYPHDQLSIAREIDGLIVFCEGEIDALSTIYHGLPAITVTNGTSGWKHEFAQQFRGLDVLIVADCDEEGRNYANKVAASLTGVANMVRVVDLPFEPDSKKDLNDYWTEGGTREGLLKLAAIVEPVPPPAVPPPVVRAAETRRNVTVTRRADPAPLPVPRAYRRTCRNEGGERCEDCPAIHDTGHQLLFTPDDDNLAYKIGRHPEQMVLSAIEAGEITNVSLRSGCLHESVETYDVHRLHAMSDDQQGMVYYVAEPNEPPPSGLVHLIGRRDTIAPPRGIPASAFIAWDYIDPYEEMAQNRPDPEAMKPFTVAPSPLEALRERARQVARDIKVWGQDLLAMMLMLSMHTAVEIAPFDNPIYGLLDVAIMGATKSAKTTLTTGMIDYYDAGSYIPGERTTVPGLTGTGRGEVATPGVLPLNDRRFVAVDEAEMLVKTGKFGELNTVRSERISVITQAGQGSWKARCRLAWIFNLPDNFRDRHAGRVYSAMVEDFTPQEMSRFDLATGVRALTPGERVEARVKALSLPPLDKRRARELREWAVTRSADQVVFPDETREAIALVVAELAEHYYDCLDSNLLVNLDQKVAKIAAIMASLMFSSPDSEIVHVRPEHVESAGEFIVELFDDPGFDMLGSVRGRQMHDTEGHAIIEQFILRNRDLAHLFIQMQRYIAGRDDCNRFRSHCDGNQWREVAKMRGIGWDYGRDGKVYVTTAFSMALESALKKLGLDKDGREVKPAPPPKKRRRPTRRPK